MKENNFHTFGVPLLEVIVLNLIQLTDQLGHFFVVFRVVLFLQFRCLSPLEGPSILLGLAHGGLLFGMKRNTKNKIIMHFPCEFQFKTKTGEMPRQLSTNLHLCKLSSRKILSLKQTKPVPFPGQLEACPVLSSQRLLLFACSESPYSCLHSVRRKMWM